MKGWRWKIPPPARLSGWAEELNTGVTMGGSGLDVGDADGSSTGGTATLG